MSFALLIMLVAVLGLVTGAGLMGFMLGRSQRPHLPAPGSHEAMDGQFERIESLENELRLLRDQADFTERLLAERGRTSSKTVDDASATD